MQVHGVGSEHNHSMHQVTECMHTDTIGKKGSAAAPSMGKDTYENSLQEKQPAEGESVLSWWRNALASGRKILGKIWGEGTGQNPIPGEPGENVAGTVEQVMAQVGDPASGEAPMGQPIGTLQQEFAASAAVPGRIEERNPYFATVEDAGKTKQTLWDKVKIRFQSVAGYLTGRFSGRNTFQTKQERPKEDLRKHSRYRQDDLEIDCVLTDDSYLLDSYDRKGEYSKLSPRK